MHVPDVSMPIASCSRSESGSLFRECDIMTSTGIAERCLSMQISYLKLQNALSLKRSITGASLNSKIIIKI